MNINKLYSTIDTQVLGEAFRIVIQSPIRFTAGSLLEKQQQLHRDFTKEKQLFLNEPRGHRGVNGCMVLSSSTASYELLFFNHPDSAAFKLEGILASLTALLETGNIAEEDNHAYTIHTAYGEYVLKADMHHQQVTAITVDTEQSITLQNQEHSIYSIDDDQKYAIRFLPEHIPSIHIDHMSDIEIWGSSELEKLKQSKQLVDGIL